VLVGSSGCGKSTVISLLQGLYFPEKGQITIEGVDIKDYNLQYLRSVFGVVSQEPVLLDESIEWNIRYNMINANS
jgi:ABC-type bacteriocin/lantibiotic exporter with double-glycine peptidase domain